MSIEPDRLELFAPPTYRFEVARRDFFRIVGSGVVVACAAGDARAQESGRTRRGNELPRNIGAWLHIAENGTVTAYTGKTEVGQNIRTSLTQAVAEELRVSKASVRLVMADTDKTPFDQGTFGSRTTPVMNLQLRRAAASARGALVKLAAERWGVDASTLDAKSGVVAHPPSGRRASYGELTRGQQLLQVIEDGPLTPADTWSELGTAPPKVNGVDFVTGRHPYTSDITRPEMLYGRILRGPSSGAVLLSADTSAAEAMAGVRVVRDAQFVGITAPTQRDAARAIDSIKAQWKEAPGPSTSTVFEYFKRTPEADPSGERTVLPPHIAGSAAEAIKSAGKVVSASYTVAYIAHVPMEPRAAVAEWIDGKLTVWTGTQRPFGVRDELAEAFRIPAERVQVIVPDTGSAYGGKHTGEAAVEAARLAKAAGRPVKLVWTRQEEFEWAYFRPAGVIDVRSGAHLNGSIVAWEYDSYNAGPAGIRTIYDFPNQRIQMHPTRSPLRVGSYRGLAATANHFVRETHLDEVAVALGLDPVQIRLRNLSDARQRAVLTTAAERAGWANGPPKGVGRGIACGFEKGSYVATVAEVAVDVKRVPRIVRLVVAYECGAIVNPDGLRNQVEGAIVQGIGGALFEQIAFENGRILNGKLESYRVPRFTDIPPIEVVLLNRKDLPPAGAGETPIIAVAPAIGNAIFAASGVRLRGLPLVPDGRLSA
jgi:nicotinate dehydrogenase subunit B